jgi:hypothetical protein
MTRLVEEAQMSQLTQAGGLLDTWRSSICLLSEKLTSGAEKHSTAGKAARREGLAAAMARADARASSAYLYSWFESGYR